ncbi:MAG: TIM barrel protein [Verrucomicrobiaceae bacterium]|nr:TIM barrel protein [Verrucomicrobiaceae bacterium]
MNRRSLITTTLAACAASALGADSPVRRRRMGLVIHSYSQRWQGRHSSLKYPPFHTPLDVLDHVRGIGVGSLQITVKGWNNAMAGQVRDTRESYGLNLEGSITLPLNEGDTGRFEQELRLGKEAGATIFRSATGGRRYETFSTLEAFKEHQEHVWKSLRLAEPLARRHGVRIGVENHKDFHATELVELLTKLGSAHIGACIDTGNNLALLEEPLAVVELLAPYAVTTHIKDMAVQECAEGFLLSEVPLGQGILDLPRLLQIIDAANPQVVHHLEMITRDPLTIPCLTEGYWATFPEKPATELVKSLAMVRSKKAEKLPHISDKSKEAALAVEEENIEKCLQYASERLGFESVKMKKALETDER